MFFKTLFAPSRSKIVVLATLALGGCALAQLTELKEDTAQRLAAPAWMVKRDIPAGEFTLRAYERMHTRHTAANVYIEGDTTSSAGLEGPTPSNPLALHLASKDDSENVVWLARPCQYVKITEENPCDAKYWGDARYSEDVLDAYDSALDEIAKRYDITNFNLIGYDGGAAVATLIAARRPDVASLRTVAGIMDHSAYTSLHGMAPLEGSLNPTSQASSLSSLPQLHFIGGQDEIVPPSILQSYLQATPPSRCVQSKLVQEAGHTAGWVNKWPELLKLSVSCYAGRMENDFSEYDLTPPVYPAEDLGVTPLPDDYIRPMTVRETPEKP